MIFCNCEITVNKYTYIHTCIHTGKYVCGLFYELMRNVKRSVNSMNMSTNY